MPHTPALPAELWAHIFYLATNDELVLGLPPPSSFDSSEWFKTVDNFWVVRSPQEVLSSLQRKGYATKKAIRLTCRTFYIIDRESLYNYIHLERPEYLHGLRAIYDAGTDIGKHTRRIHLLRPPSEVQENFGHSELEHLDTITSWCPSLDTFIVEGQLSRRALSHVADSLCTWSRRSLRILQLTLPTDALPKLIWSLSSLPRLQSASFEFYRAQTPRGPRGPRRSVTPMEVETELPLGAAAGLQLTVTALTHLTVRGHSAQFIEQACDWLLPRLRSFTIDRGHGWEDLPDVIEFLVAHGTALEHLDLDGFEPVDVPEALEHCPVLRTLVFNPDWKQPMENENDPVRAMALISHPGITHIGLHGLLDAFGVAPGSGAGDPYGTPTPAQLQVTLRRRTNDSVFRALTRKNFPSLRVVRAVSRSLLSHLEESNGPGTEAGCFERWEQWWSQCATAGVRLEDCTGAFLGNLPEEASQDYSDEEGESEEESGSEESYSEEEVEEGPGQEELRQLLEECRKMNATRDLDTGLTRFYSQLASMPL